MSRRRLTPDNLPTGSSDPVTPTPRAGDLFYRTDTGRVRVYTGTVWTDAGLLGSTGPAGGQELAYAEALSNYALTLGGGLQDPTGMQITVPAGQAFNLVCLVSLTATSNAAAGTAFGPSFQLTDAANVVQYSITLSFGLPASGSVLVIPPFYIVRRMAALASPTTYKLRVNPTNTANVTGPATYTGVAGSAPIFIAAHAR